MKYIKEYINFITKEVTTYHGGYKEINNNNLELPIYTTTDREAAMSYVDKADKNYIKKKFEGWLTVFKVMIKNPLTNHNKYDFINKWIPILEESGIEYTYNKDSFKSSEILNYGGHTEDNPNDLIFIPKFVEAAKKRGYDGIISKDKFEGKVIDVYIPFKQECVRVINNLKLK